MSSCCLSFSIPYLKGAYRTSSTFTRYVADVYVSGVCALGLASYDFAASEHVVQLTPALLDVSGSSSGRCMRRVGLCFP